MFNKLSVPCFVIGALLIGNANAWIFVDPTNLIQNTISASEAIKTGREIYIQGRTQLKQFQAQKDSLMNLKNQFNRLTEMKDLSIQNLAELQNISGLFLGNDEVINRYTGKSDYSRMGSLDPENGGYERNRDVILSKYYHIPENPSTVEDTFSGVMSPEMINKMEEDAQLRKGSWDRVLDGLEIYAKKQKMQQRREAQIDNFGQQIRSLGPKSSLKTQQLTAAQLHFMLQQQEVQQETLRNIEKNQLESMAQTTSAGSQDFDREAKRLKEASSKRTNGLGRERWGDL